MRFIPKNPTLAEIVQRQYGTLENYLNDPLQMSGNNNLNYRDIMLLLDVSIAAAVDKTGRNKRTVMKWRDIREQEAQANGN
jgi:hypothetical protein